MKQLLVIGLMMLICQGSYAAQDKQYSRTQIKWDFASGELRYFTAMLTPHKNVQRVSRPGKLTLRKDEQLVFTGKEVQGEKVPEAEKMILAKKYGNANAKSSDTPVKSPDTPRPLAQQSSKNQKSAEAPL